ncbi:MAG: S-adenosyl-L-methionine-dependent methyltransferase [Piptocephalis tieghemiana]|nr:MAG: S-adenosyl-L-methionine-dependent methyltransferase [Piptocephalis tieghemiana]
MKYLFAQAIRDMEPDLEDEVVNAQIKGIPERWELYKDFALLSPRALIDPPIEERFQALAIASISRVLGVGHLARKSAIPKEDPLRRPKLIPLLGTFSSASPSSHQPVDPSPGTLTEEEVEGEFWTRIKQHGVTYVWAPARTMFSTGNITEKDRVSRLGKEGEVVVDLFAGIGYFSLVFARRCRARLVHACEWNPWSIQGLCRGAKANGIPYLVHGQQEGRIPPRMIIYPGDNALAGPHFIGQADRVHLGLLPDAEGSFGLACQSLRPTGGWMHVHANVLDGQEKMWGKRVENLLRDHLQRIHSHTVTWMVRVRWLERVKGWSPGIGHWVADVECCREAVPVP